jgi:uncharacterized membrane protein
MVSAAVLHDVRRRQRAMVGLLAGVLLVAGIFPPGRIMRAVVFGR